MKELPRRDFDLGAKGYFFLSNSFRIHEGEVIGFWINPSEDGEKYYYQMQYEIDQLDDTKATRWATVSSEDIFEDENTASETFKPLKKDRMEEAIKNVKLNLEGRKVDKKQLIEDVEDLEVEEKRLLTEYEGEYGKYVEVVESGCVVDEFVDGVKEENKEK